MRFGGIARIREGEPERARGAAALERVGYVGGGRWLEWKISEEFRFCERWTNLVGLKFA